MISLQNIIQIFLKDLNIKINSNIIYTGKIVNMNVYNMNVLLQYYFILD